MQVFAPANLRAAADNKAYADLVSAYIAERYTLRYTGGFVPDINHILAKVSHISASLLVAGCRTLSLESLRQELRLTYFTVALHLHPVVR